MGSQVVKDDLESLVVNAAITAGCYLACWTFVLDKGYCSVAQASLKLAVLLTPASECWNYRYVQITCSVFLYSRKCVGALKKKNETCHLSS